MTFYRDTTDLPAFSEYNMAGRTYRHFKGKPLDAFGHGLSYTTFGYTQKALAYWGDATHAWAVEGGAVSVEMGAASDAIRTSKSIVVKGGGVN